MSDGPRTWPKASRDLARRVERRDRLGALLRPLGLGLLAAALGMLLLKALGQADSALPWLLAIGPVVLGLAVGLRRLGRVRGVDAADAAWALDRLAGARERGLVAATVEGAAAGEAAWGPGRIAPPEVRLHAPRGLALCLASLLLLAVAALAPSRRAAERTAPPAPRTSVSRQAAAAREAEGQAELDEAQARADEAEAEAAAAVREALGLGPSGARDPARLAERLQDPTLHQDARAAAAPGTRVAELLGGADTVPEDLASALAAGEDAAQDARDARRRAVATRAGGALAPIPPERRAFLERYFQSYPPQSSEAPGVR